MFFAAGKISTGRCDTLDGESVRTRFIFIGPILIPVDSIYGTKEGPIPIRRSMASIALAYLRWFVAPIVVFGTFIASTADVETPADMSFGAKLTLLAMLVAWFVLVFFSGFARGKAARQRRSFARFLSHRAPPEMLFDGTLALALDELQRKWESVAPEQVAYRVDATTKVKWRDLYPKDVSPELLYLYYALCRYYAAKNDDETMSNRARLAWERIEREI